MKMYAALLAFVDDYVERRAPYRSEHLANLERLRTAGKVVLGGAWNDPVDGELIVYRAANKGEVEALVRADPYFRAGLWPEFTIREWNVVIGAPG